MEKHRKELGKTVRVGILYSGFSCFYFTFFSICFCCTKLVIIHLVNNVSCPFKYKHFTGLRTFEGSLQTNLAFVLNS